MCDFISICICWWWEDLPPSTDPNKLCKVMVTSNYNVSLYICKELREWKQMWASYLPTVCYTWIHICFPLSSSPLDAKLFQCGNAPSTNGRQSIPMISLNHIFSFKATFHEIKSLGEVLPANQNAMVTQIYYLLFRNTQLLGRKGSLFSPLSNIWLWIAYTWW